jgi:hypothetical protein
VLEVIKAMGYRKVAEPQSLQELAKQKTEHYQMEGSSDQTPD